ncbi:MAG: sulfatase [Candidatus Pacebacteria bacterium]|nr:sulfatase [Candidatus Paceibacterota bacterium]
MTNRPNIVFITSHDSGRHFGCYGVPTVRTPAVDGLASDGVKMTSAFSAAPVCTPSRGAMMSGRWPQTNGLMGLAHAPHHWHYNPGEKHLSHLLRKTGYQTYLFGFQHETEDPSELGFDDMFGVLPPMPSDTMPDPYAHLPGCETARLFESFCARQSRSADTPFYAQVGFFESHRPFDFAGNEGDDQTGVYLPPIYARDDVELQEEFRMLQGALHLLDQAIGSVLESLDQHGLRENTIVIYTTDHGIDMPRAKGTLYDLGTEVALLMHWPDGGLSGGRTCDRLVSQTDLTPTLLELIGEEVPNFMQGQSFAASLSPEIDEHGEERPYVFTMFHGPGTEIRAVRSKHYKLLRNFMPGRTLDLPIHNGAPRSAKSLPFVELYDVLRNPTETENLADNPDYRDVRDELDAVLLRHMRTVNDPILRGPIPSPYYLRAKEKFVNLSKVVVQR